MRLYDIEFDTDSFLDELEQMQRIRAQKALRGAITLRPAGGASNADSGSPEPINDSPSEDSTNG